MLRYLLLVIACVGVMRADLVTSVEVDKTINGVTTVACSVTGTTHADCDSSFGQISADATYGYVSATTIFEPPFPNPDDERDTVYARAYLSDMITITGRTGQAFAVFQLTGDYDLAPVYFNGDDLMPGHGTSYSAVPFTFGTPFVISAEADSSGDTASFNYSELEVSSIEVDGYNGYVYPTNQVFITAASGREYDDEINHPYPFYFTPEPATALLIGPVVLLVGLFRRTRNTRSSLG